MSAHTIYRRLRCVRPSDRRTRNDLGTPRHDEEVMREVLRLKEATRIPLAASVIAAVATILQSCSQTELQGVWQLGGDGRRFKSGDSWLGLDPQTGSRKMSVTATTPWRR